MTDVFVDLLYSPKSAEAQNLIDRLVAEFLSHRKRKGKIDLGLAALIPNLLAAEAKGPGTFCFRNMSTKAFSGQPVTARPFQNATKFLEKADYLERVRRIADPKTGIVMATRLRGTTKLFELAKDFGIPVSRWGDHFERRAKAYLYHDPVTLRSASRRGWSTGANPTWGKIPGRTLPVDRTNKLAHASWRLVEELNEYWSRQTLGGGCDQPSFQRIFSEGANPANAYRRGGRLYAVGGGYQSMKRKDRPSITINGESTIELDIKASFLIIFHGLLGAPAPPADPYYVPGIPRPVVKAWVSSSFGKGKLSERWSVALQEAENERAKEESRAAHDLMGDYPIRDIRDPILHAIPVLRRLEGSGIDWGLLQYAESEAVIGAIYRLMKECDAPALPMHDGIIVPASKASIGEMVLVECFQNQTGILPKIERK